MDITVLAQSGFDWVEALGPTAGVVLVVLFFLRYLSNERKSREQEESIRMMSLQEMGKRHSDRAGEREDKLAACVDRNTKAYDEYVATCKREAEVQGQVLEALRRFNGSIR